MKTKYQKTLLACYLGFITQAIAANFAPLLFLTFHKGYGIPLGTIALISGAFFLTQLVVDVLCARFADKIGYRRCAVAAELCSAAGLIGLAFLPDLLPSPFAGILLSVITYAVGSGLIEVLGSPIVEACPFAHKEAVMSLLHSFYCWGSVGVVLLSTLFFAAFGLSSWKLLACLVGLKGYRTAGGGAYVWLPEDQWGSLALTLESVCLFSLLRRAKGERVPRPVGWWVARTAKLALPMYLVSYIADQTVYPVLAQAVPEAHHRLFAMPIVVPVTVLCSQLLAQPVDWAAEALVRLAPQKTKNAQES